MPRFFFSLALVGHVYNAIFFVHVIFIMSLINIVAYKRTHTQTHTVYKYFTDCNCSRTHGYEPLCLVIRTRKEREKCETFFVGYINTLSVIMACNVIIFLLVFSVFVAKTTQSHSLFILFPLNENKSIKLKQKCIAH